MSTWIFNDLHLGVKRTGGTTQASAAAMREWSMQQFRSLLGQVPNGQHVVINGDLTDLFDIPLADVVGMYEVIVQWADARPNSLLHAAVGNHDLSKDSTKLGSVEFLFGLLNRTHPNIRLVSEASALTSSLYVIPHVVNQAQFDLELERVPQGVKQLLLHCNFDSPFAEHADHSLNISRAQAQGLIDRGVTLVLGHEHHQRVLMGGKVVIPGNQFPTSIADCVTPEGRQIRKKQFAVITDAGEVELCDSWSADGDAGFHQISIDGDLDQTLTGFIRIVGEVQPEGTAEALRKISRLRQTSEAFVITNSLRVAGHSGAEIEDALEGIEDVRGIDVIQMLLETLTPEQQEAVRAVLASQN